MAGTTAGKRSESNILPKMTSGLVGSMQNKFNNYEKMRDLEERLI